MGPIGWPELLSIGGLLCLLVPVLAIALVVWLVRRNKQPPAAPPPSDQQL